MSRGNNTQTNGTRRPSRYTLLKPGENTETDVPWLERFTAFYQKRLVNFEPHWRVERADNGDWIVRVLVNNHELGVVGRGKDQQTAKACLVKELERSRHNILHMPLLPEYLPADNGNPTVDETPSVSSGSSPENTTPNNGTSNE